MSEGQILSTGLGWAVALLAVLSVLCSLLSAMIERSGPVRLRHWVEEADGRLRRAFDESVRFEAYRYLLSLAAKVSPVLLALALGALLERLGVGAPFAWGVVPTLALVAGTEIANRVLVARAAEEVLSALTPVYRLLLVVLAPAILLLGAAWRRYPPTVPAGEELEEEDEGEASDEEIEAFLAFGTREGILEPGEEKMVWGIVDLGETPVRSVMTPRIDIACAAVDASRGELVQAFLESGHSRLPLYEESIDRVVGILHIRDLLRSIDDPQGSSARDLAKPPFFVPETKALNELLKEMQERHQQMAIVVDEYGGTAGLVTIEDLLEEIVGEIIDEHEVEQPEVEALADGSWRLDGRVHLETVEEFFGTETDEAPYETLGGLIFSTLGYVPEVGETITWQNLRLQVESLSERRIQTVRVERLPEPEADGAGAPPEESRD